MTEQLIEDIAVQVDEATLARLGWTVQDVRGRLVTETSPRGTVAQRIAVAGTARLAAAGRTGALRPISEAPRVVLTLARHGSTQLPSHLALAGQNPFDAADQPTRFTTTSETWRGPIPLTPADLDLRITGYDLGDVDDTQLKMPAERSTPLPVTVLDETAQPSLRVTAHAEATRDEYESMLHVCTEGVVEPASGEQQGPGHDPSRPVPDFLVEITDDNDFLLANRTVRLGGSIPARGTTTAPRFLTGFRVRTDYYAGTPSQVTIRIRDVAGV